MPFSLRRFVGRLPRPSELAARVLAGAVLAAAVGAGPPLAAADNDEIGYVESFAWSSDRETALKQLIPGTEDYYFFHCLHYQNTERLQDSARMLELWAKRLNNRSPRWRTAWHRQQLLSYAQDPQSTLSHLRRELGLRFDHQRERMGEKPNLPNELEPRRLDRDELERIARQQSNLSGFEDSALYWLLDTELNATERRRLLTRLTLPDHPKLVQQVSADLAAKDSGGFGSLSIHGRLTLRQLNELLELRPSLLNHDQFVAFYVAKLRPSNDEDWEHDADVQRQYLTRLWDFVSRLGPAHNSRKAHALFHRLDFDRTHGVYDKQRFLAYLRLPRNAAYVSRQLLERDENRRHTANLQQDFDGTRLPPVGPQDESLVRDYFDHFFREEKSYDAYLPLVKSDYLKRLFAETKAVYGLGDPERWASLLSPAEYQALKDRIDLDFDAQNKQVFRADEPVSLDLHVKNVDKLIVKIFHINTVSHARGTLQPVNTDIELDGLVANHQMTLHYDEPPLRRVRRHFDLPKLTVPGVYVVDFIGNGRSSRAVIRKGTVRSIVRATSAGQAVTVLDEDGELAKDVTIWFGGAEYQPNTKGHTLLPFSTEGRRKTASYVIHHGGQAFVKQFVSLPEAFSLEAGFVLNRELLRSHQEAAVLFRPQLTVNGVPAPVSLLEDVELRILATDLDGVPTTLNVGDLELHQDRETRHVFQTPSRLASLHFTLTAKVRQATKGGKRQTLSASHSVAVNQIEATTRIADTHLIWSDRQYRVQLLGRTGEPLADRAVHVELKHKHFTRTIHADLQTNPAGLVQLGELADIDWVKARATVAGMTTREHVWALQHDFARHAASIHLRHGETATTPAVGISAAHRDQVALLEICEGQIVADRFDHVRVGGGLLSLVDLPPGDYQLVLKQPGHVARVRVAAGSEVTGFALGAKRMLELAPPPVAVAELKADEESITMRLVNATPETRVHVLSTRFQPPFSAYHELAGLTRTGLSQQSTRLRASLFAENRRIGDEYDYIIRRQAAKPFPGNMLGRPTLLLNPWSLRATETDLQLAALGKSFGRTKDMPAAPAEPPATPGADKTAPGGPSDYATLNWLDTGALLANLPVDEEGLCTAPIAALEGGQHVRVLIVSGNEVIQRTLSLPAAPQSARDLRLARSLNPDKHLIQQKNIAVIQAGETFTLRSAESARFESIDSLSDAYQLFETLRPDDNFRAFRFVLQWPELSEEEKRDKYSEFASHELNFFLLHKDPKFFRQVVAPFLASKLDKTFMDLYLIDASLRQFLEPWRHGRLNTAEQVLIGRQIAAEAPRVARHVADMVAVSPRDPAAWSKLFDTAVKRSSLSTATATSGVELSLQLRGAMPTDSPTTEGLSLAERAPLRAPLPAAAPSPTKPQSRPAAQASGREAYEFKKQPANKRARLGDAEDARRRSGLRDRALLGLDADGAIPEQLYVKLDKTREWAENNYYHLPIESQGAELVKANRFWEEYARHQQGPFVSQHLAEASGTFTECMLALAVLDLPWEAAEHEVEFEGRDMKIAAASPVVFFHEGIREPEEEQEGRILVSQNLFRANDRYRQVGNQRVDKFVTDEFLPHMVYGCQIVVTNPTSAPQELNVLTQIPAGSLPLGKGKATQNIPLSLPAFQTARLEFTFYFPQVGDFAMYPAHVAAGDVLMASAEPRTLKVVASLSSVDRDSWAYVSQNGEPQAVLEYLRSHNLQRTKLDRIAFRMRDADFFAAVTDLLEKRHLYNRTLWSYAVQHDLPKKIRQFLRHEDSFVKQCGPYLKSPLLTIDPVERKTYQHLAYMPLVNARAHQLGARRRILNDRLHQQYHALLRIHSCRPQLDDDDRMSATYYLLLQDRVEEALKMFGQVNPERLETPLQHDYFAAYLAFYTGDLKVARQLAEEYQDYPVDRWRDSFAAVAAQLSELDGGATEAVDPQDREQRQAELASEAPSFEFDVAAGRVTLKHQNIERVAVRYYLMDIELLFSRNPFVKQYRGQFSHIQPNERQEIELKQATGAHEFELPESLDNKNVLVEITAAGVTETSAHYANSLNVQLSERYGQLRVASDAGKPLSKCYIKVFARVADGSVKFYKDGYTDLRGRFDYASLSTADSLPAVKQFSILVMSPSHGATVREATPPGF